MSRRRFRCGLLAVLLAGGCAGTSPVQVGHAAGAAAGTAIAPGIGTQLGSLVGMLVGMLVQQRVDQVTETRERRDLGRQLATGGDAAATPAAPPPAAGIPTRVWVDETFKDGRVIAGHFEERRIL